MPKLNPLVTPAADVIRPEHVALLGPHHAPPAPPDPPYQPWLRGAASLALIRQGPDPDLPARRKRAPFLFHHPRRSRLEQMLVIAGCVFPFAFWPGQGRTRITRLPVIGQAGAMRPESRAELDRLIHRDVKPDNAIARPRTRADCAGGIRPCPWVSCRHHLFLEVNPSSGALRLNHPGKEVSDLVDSCSLDVAERVAIDPGLGSLTRVAGLLGISHERVRQIEGEAKGHFTFANARKT